MNEYEVTFTNGEVVVVATWTPEAAQPGHLSTETHHLGISFSLAMPSGSSSSLVDSVPLQTIVPRNAESAGAPSR